MTIEELLDQHDPGIAELCRRLLEHIEAAAAWSERKVYARWHGVGFHHGALGYVVGVFPRTADVRVLFEHGYLLGGARYLDGSGQTRYVDFAEWNESRLATVDEMLDRALAE